MPRDFWLENSKGETMSLLSPSIFFNEPEGLGFKTQYTSVKLGSSRLIKRDGYNLESVSVRGDILFTDPETAYDDYLRFVKFVSFVPLYLHYKPNKKSYFCRIEISELGKSEIKPEGYMTCPITFDKLSVWFTDDINILTRTKRPSGVGKSYPLTRPYHYSSTELRNTKIVNTGTVDAPITFEIYGRTTDPEVYIYDALGELYGICKIDGTYDYVKVVSDDLDQDINLRYQDLIYTDAVNYQDLSVSNGEVDVTFLKAKVGESTMNFSLGEEFDGSVIVSWRSAYVSV